MKGFRVHGLWIMAYHLGLRDWALLQLLGGGSDDECGAPLGRLAG